MNSIILIGPKIWADEHIDCINEYNSVWLRYDSQSPDYVRENLHKMQKLFIYVPLKFDLGGRIDPPILGSGTVEFEGIIDDFRVTDIHLITIRNPKPLAPIINQKNPKYYIQDNIVRFVDNFHLNKLERLIPGLDIENFAIYTNNKTSLYIKYIRKYFPHEFAHKIALAHYPASEVIK
jgi:hypothetical protein